MGEREEKKKKKNKNKKSTTDAHFKPSSDVKGIRFGGQFIVKSFTVRRAAPLELTNLLDIPIIASNNFPFPSTTAYVPTNFTILAHHAWHTLTLGLGAKKSKILIFVFESEAMKAAVDGVWRPMIPPRGGEQEADPGAGRVRDGQVQVQERVPDLLPLRGQARRGCRVLAGR